MQYSLNLVLSWIASLAKLFRILPPCTSNLRMRRIKFRRGIPREWAFVLVAILLTNTVVMAGTSWCYRRDFHYTSSADNLRVAHHKVFANEIVPLDGRRYVACVFRNATLEYDGTAPFALEENQFTGSLTLTTKNKSISAAIFLLKGLGLTTIPIFDSETGEAVHNLGPSKVQTVPSAGE